ncbi:MAG: FecR family protein [Mangrovibacterium sp.]
MEAQHQNDIMTLLGKMFHGTLDETEKAYLQAYIESTFQDERLNEFMEKHWTALETAPGAQREEDLHAVKEKIRSMIRNGEQPVPHVLKREKSRLITFLVRSAAILTIPLLILSGYLYYRLTEQSASIGDQTVMQQVIATPGSRVHFVLPDQSEVWLNSGSSLEFPGNLNDHPQRRVKLQGQGYFMVAKDEQHPFIVETDQLNIQVLGTSFDVSNYANDDFISSTLEEGTIALLDPYNKELVSLKPGQQALFSKKTRQLTVNQIDTRLTTSWKDGKLIFRDTPLRNVTQQLERWFNCRIQVAPKLMNSGILYTATIQDETLGEVLQMIEISTQVKTQIKNREVRIWIE